MRDGHVEAGDGSPGHSTAHFFPGFLSAHAPKLVQDGNSWLANILLTDCGRTSWSKRFHRQNVESFSKYLHGVQVMLRRFHAAHRHEPCRWHSPVA